MGNGQVLGANNTPTSSAAQGVWGLQDLYNARLVNAWPSVVRLGEQGLVDFIYINAKSGITGDVFNYVPPYPVGDAGTGNFTASSSTFQFTLTNHRLAVGDQLKFVEGGGTLPNPIVEGQIYYVESVPTANTFTVSATDGGIILPLTSNGTTDNDRRVFKYPLENDPSGGFNLEVEIFHYDLVSYPSGLTVTTTLRLGEDADKPERITAVVVDGNFNISGGTIGVTNGKNRLGFAVMSRASIDVGGGRGIIQPMFTLANETDNSVGKFRPWRLSSTTPFTDGYIKRGGDGGRGGGPNPLIPAAQVGGGGGGAFGGVRGLPVPNSFAGIGTQGSPIPPSSRAGAGGGSPAGTGINSGFLPDGGFLILSGDVITVPPTGQITAKGGNGGRTPGGDQSPPFWGGGGGAGGSNIVIYYSGSYSNNGTVTAAGGTGGPGTAPPPGGPNVPGVPGGAGTIIAAPIPSGVINA